MLSTPIAVALQAHITTGAMALAPEVKRHCAETRSAVDLLALDSIVMILVAFAGLSATAVAVLAARPATRISAIVLAGLHAVHCVIAWYGFAHRHDTIVPFCGGRRMLTPDGGPIAVGPVI
ncbi:hypothetical protein ACQ7HM_10495 [Williamsia sp. MIQD14]|uniref:hypothetical protein n=1 Tax=Williamsia sp. MIQD14 TaxID=3425703 RepID=UPI003DA0B2F2